MSKKLKKRLIRIIFASSLFVPLLIIDKVIDLSHFYGFVLPLCLYLAIYLLISYDILIKAFKNIIRGHVFDENFLMIIASIGAFVILEFPEAVAVMLLYQIGEFFQDLAVGRSRQSISELMDIRPEYANLLKEDGSIEIVDPELVQIGQLIRVEPGEKIPLDGIIVSGSSSIDTKSLTGESMPVDVIEGSDVISGTINLSASIDIRVKKEYKDSAVSKILELVENATNTKSKQENFISKFAKWYTPIVVISALILFGVGFAVTKDWSGWLAKSLNFLVVSCPCAIVISVPLSFFAAIGKAAKLGILIKGSLYLENFNRAKTFVFDKTGTLTKGNFVISKVVPEANKAAVLEAASIAESQSSHPIALVIKSALKTEPDATYKIENIPGKGIIASKENDVIFCGNFRLFSEKNIKFDENNEAGTIIYVARNNEYLGMILVKDEIKDEARKASNYFKKEHIETIMLTGDNEWVAKEVSTELGLSSYKASLLPQDKVAEFEKILESKNGQSLVAYVGDGINDAPVIARSDIGISMGGVGSDAAIEASDIVLMHDNLMSLITAKRIAKKTMRIVIENIVFAITVKVAILVLSIFFPVPIWIAIFGDVGVALICVLNALRCGNNKKED